MLKQKIMCTKVNLLSETKSSLLLLRILTCKKEVLLHRSFIIRRVVRCYCDLQGHGDFVVWGVRAKIRLFFFLKMCWHLKILNSGACRSYVPALISSTLLESSAAVPAELCDVVFCIFSWNPQDLASVVAD